MTVSGRICMCLPTKEQILFEEMKDSILFCSQMYNRCSQCSDHALANKNKYQRRVMPKYDDSTLEQLLHKR